MELNMKAPTWASESFDYEETKANFDLKNEPVAHSELVFVGGAIQREGKDYEIDGNTLRFIGGETPESEIYVKYQTLS